MAVLNDTDRQRISTGLQRYWSRLFEEILGIEADLLAAVNATDTWIDNNQASYNSALPSAAQINLTATQKILLFCVVAAMRVNVKFAKRLVGEVD